MRNYALDVAGKTDKDRECAARVCGWIRFEKKRRRVSQNEMAKRMGLSSGTLSRYMTGDKTPPCGFVLRAAEALHEVTTTQLLLEDPPAEFMTQEQDPDEPETSPPQRRASVPPAQARRHGNAGGGGTDSGTD